MQIGIFKVLGLLGLLADELSKAAEDNKITVNEALNIVKRICERLGIDFDEEGFDLS